MLHKRFAAPGRWRAFLAHVRRGGYARDLQESETRREFSAFKKAKASGKEFELRILRSDRAFKSKEWWEQLTLDPACAEPGFPKPSRTTISDRFDWNETNVTITRPNREA